VAAEHAQRHGAGVSHIYRHALRGYAARLSTQAAARIASDPRVASVVPDREIGLLHHCPQPGHPHCPTDPDPDPGDYDVPTGLSRSFWENSSAVDSTVGVGVAIIDTGISSHADLNIAGGVNCNTGGSYSDGHGHGTHVAGTVAANGTIVGVARGAPLYAVRVLSNSGSGSWAQIICGVDWVTARASFIKVANMSLGGSGSEGSCNDGGLRQAICASVAAGVTYAVAAGNSATDASSFVPATYPEVITVSALADFDGAPGGLGSPTCRSDVDDTHANFSNYGDDVDIIAPGVCIESTWNNGGRNTISGTSMASPHVAGAAALYLQNNSGASPSQVRNALRSAGNFNYSYTWNGSSPVPGTKPPLLDVGGL
jgi:subtilisin family serine protease